MQGDVFLVDQGGANGDLIRFNNNGTLVFYSDMPPIDTLADTALPGQFYGTTAITLESAQEGANGVTYTPLNSQPGFDSLNPATYIITSDGASVPEPVYFCADRDRLARLNRLVSPEAHRNRSLTRSRFSRSTIRPTVFKEIWRFGRGVRPS